MARIRIADLLNGGDECEGSAGGVKGGVECEERSSKRRRHCIRGMEEVNTSDSPRGVEEVGMGFVGGGEGVNGMIGVGEEETCVLPNVYVESEAMGVLMDVRGMLCEGYEGGEDVVEKGWRVEGSMKERREKRRNAARAARVGKEGIEEEGGVENGVAKALEKRMKNRAAVNKCRLKQRERIEQLETEKMELSGENGRMKQMLGWMEELVKEERSGT